jgi:hypothetical protein
MTPATPRVAARSSASKSTSVSMAVVRRSRRRQTEAEGTNPKKPAKGGFLRSGDGA